MVKIWLAPLHGITNHVFRNTLANHAAGIDAVITPFLPVLPAEKIKISSWKDILPENNTKWETTPQLMGNVVSHFIDTAKALYDIGYPSVNWNLGCPMNQIVRKKRGCGLMPHPEIIEELLRKGAKENLSISLKIRMGLHDRKEGRKIIEICNNYPLNFIVIHPRLGEWLYEGKPDLEEFELLYQISKHRIIYNGDIKSVCDLLALQQRFPKIEDWMIGRGLLQNPFLAEEIKGVKNDKQVREERFRRYYTALRNEILINKGERCLLPALKEMWHYFAVFWNLEEQQLYDLLRVNDLNSFDHEIKKIANNL